MQDYDAIVIGSGPAGEKGAATAAALGKRVAMIEKNTALGGASANTGTLPSKTLRETALALTGMRARNLYGVDLSLRREANIRDVMYHETQVKARERARVLDNIRQRGVDLYTGAARFLDANRIDTGRVQLRAEKILIATGSSPYRPPGFAFEDDRIHDSDELLEIEWIPKTLAVVGAGVIGVEYACTFAALGCEVHLIDGRDALLPFLDREVSLALEKSLAMDLRIQFHKKEMVKSCDSSQPGQVHLECESGQKLSVDQVLVAAGRTSNTAALNLEAAGVTLGKRGLIPVNEQYQTNIPHIYAAGDVIGFPALSSTSSAQGRLAMGHAFGFLEKSSMAALLPTGIYTIPEISMVGETEESLQTKGIPYLVGRASYSDNARGQIIGDCNGFLKLLFAQSDFKLLGVHVIGELASELAHTGMMVMLAGGGAELLERACFNYPTLGDLYETATHDVVLQCDLALRRTMTGD
ncbi:Si-specific NAD(P)(+) transhydrogenase [uncultured Paludibaculum sp.]|uniref:Si-specific NAD(P)(+) transhydrogenase n=1 Tax=uncultured Paludibaculum sp. TaxID=1765020 RepID=UPI002AABCB7C|nr:Si-specific NAD(P)(+) transhydrogenase [uncultured Paludibaculum sp.]